MLLRFFILTLSFCFLFTPFANAREKSQEICQGYTLQGKRHIKITDNEKILMCGDSHHEEWKKIPPNQALFHLRTFLEERGYFHSTVEGEPGHFLIHLGERTFIKKIKVAGEPSTVKIEKRRRVLGQELTPTNLSSLEKWFNERLRANGYPCPEVKSVADVDTGEVKISINKGPYQDLISIEEEPVKGLNEDILRRYDAFKLNKPYNEDFLGLTATRTELDGVIQNTFFAAECRREGAIALQKTIAGKPRLLNVGFGANTESYGLVRANWKHARMGKMGSSVDVRVYGSYLKQAFETEAKWYVFHLSRWHLNPLLSFSHEDEKDYQFISGQMRLSPAFTWDNQYMGLTMNFGPNLNYTQTYSGPAPGLTRFLSLHYDLDLKSHYFEFYKVSPRKGFQLMVDGDFNHESLFSNVTAQRFNIYGEKLWNILDYDPPLVVLGVRGGYGTTWVDKTSENLNDLPASYRYYLGGSQNLRGFGRRELPQSTEGGLSMAYASLEARFGVLPLNLEPFVFTDAGALGSDSFLLDSPVYFSPGIGLRWQSPIGVFRTTLAHGLVWGEENTSKDHSHIQFYISFGEEF